LVQIYSCDSSRKFGDAIEVSKSTGKLFKEDNWNRRHPRITAFKKLVSSGAIGNVISTPSGFIHDGLDPTNVSQINGIFLTLPAIGWKGFAPAKFIDLRGSHSYHHATHSGLYENIKGCGDSVEIGEVIAVLGPEYASPDEFPA